MSCDKKSMTPEKFATVIIDRSINKPLDYKIPESLLKDLKVGSRVIVPLRKNPVPATIIDIHNHKKFANTFEIEKIVSNRFALPEDLVNIAKWMQKYYCCSIEKAFHCIFSHSVKKEINPPQKILIRLKQTKSQLLETLPSFRKKAPKAATILDVFLKSEDPISIHDLIHEYNFQRSTIESLVKKEILQKEKLKEEDFDFWENLSHFKEKKLTFTDEQQKCFESILESIEKKMFEVHLIHGITGSGKTEIYLQLIEKVLEKNQNILVLLPEIALTSQMIERFQARLDVPLAAFHYKKSAGQRQQLWQDIEEGKFRVVLGARSSIFIPMPHIGLIIVDEEHDGSFKQSEKTPFYNGRDVAIMRAHFSKIPIILGSATPSLESYQNALNQKYRLHTILKRPSTYKKAKVHLLDMKEVWKKNGGFTHFSPLLLNKLTECVKKGEQALLFLNRRGYYTSFFCKDCGHVVGCPHCDLSLTYHKTKHLLTCHLCGYTKPPVRNCPKCKSSVIQYKGFGTEHVEKSLNAIFPEVRTLRMDRDTTSKKESHENILKQFRSGKADVLIGTQMIAKGFHFPLVTLVGILHADFSLNIPDFRSSEKVFQVLTQVAGRAGRDVLEGEVIIQTFLPDHPIIQKAMHQDYLDFFQYEIEQRKLFQYPPFLHMIKCTFTGEKEKETMEYAEHFKKTLDHLIGKTYIIHPVCACGYAKIKDKYRFQILIRGQKIFPLTDVIKKIKKPSSIYLSVDVDPLCTFL